MEVSQQTGWQTHKELMHKNPESLTKKSKRLLIQKLSIHNDSLIISVRKHPADITYKIFIV